MVEPAAGVADAWLKGADLTLSHLEHVDFYGLKPGSLANVHWYGAFLDRTRMRREQLGDAVGEEETARENVRRREANSDHLTSEQPNRRGYGWKDLIDFQAASDVYLELKNNFMAIGQYEGASWAYRKEQEMKGEAYWQAWRKERNAKSFRALMGNRLSKYVAGYGEDHWRPIWMAGAVIVFFWGVYLLASLLTSESMGLLDTLIFSSATFFAVGFGSLEPACWFVQVLAVIESALGLGLFALLIWTIGNRISRS